jgi:AraC-like DNA-binding protein
MQEQQVEHVPADAAGSLQDPGAKCASRPLPAPTFVPGGLAGGKLRRVADHIDANLGGELTLGELSGVVHMSPFHFARLFKRKAGVAPHRFVVRRRVDRAIELLAGGELPIGEIARLVGYATPSHFTTVFRRITGVTPTEYRRVAGSGPAGRDEAAWGGDPVSTPPRGPDGTPGRAAG